jgi:hypothetical protein
VHERTHRNDRPFECSICNQKFYRKEPMQKHQWRQHGIVHFKGKPPPHCAPAQPPQPHHRQPQQQQQLLPQPPPPQPQPVRSASPKPTTPPGATGALYNAIVDRIRNSSLESAESSRGELGRAGDLVVFLERRRSEAAAAAAAAPPPTTMHSPAASAAAVMAAAALNMSSTAIEEQPEDFSTLSHPHSDAILLSQEDHERHHHHRHPDSADDESTNQSSLPTTEIVAAAAARGRSPSPTDRQPLKLKKKLAEEYRREMIKEEESNKLAVAAEQTPSSLAPHSSARLLQ